MRHLICSITSLLVVGVGIAADPLPDGAVTRLGYARLVAGTEQNYEMPVLSRDGRIVLASGRWLNVETGKEVPPPVKLEPGQSLVRWFADGSYLTRDEKKDLCIFKPNGELKNEVHGIHEMPIGNQLFAFDAEGRRVLRAFEFKEVSLKWATIPERGRITEWKTIFQASSHISNTTRAKLAANGSRVLWVENENHKYLAKVFDVQTGKTLTLQPYQPDAHLPFEDACISSDGKLAAFYSDGVQVYDAATGQHLRSIPLNIDSDFPQSKHLQFTPDGKRLVFDHGSRWHLVPLSEQDRVRSVEIPYRMRCHVLLPDSKRILTEGEGGVLRVHDLVTGKQLDSHSHYNTSWAGVKIVDEHKAICWNDSGRLLTWDTRTGKELADVTLKEIVLDEHRSFLDRRETNYHFGPRGKHVLVMGQDDSGGTLF